MSLEGKEKVFTEDFVEDFGEPSVKEEKGKEKVVEIIRRKRPLFRLIRTETSIEDLSILEIARRYKPKGWESFFDYTMPELEEVSKVIENIEKETKKSAPLRCNIFRAFDCTDLSRVRVVILGQDPYYQILPNGQPRAVGLSFSVSRDDFIPDSLKNIYKEISNSIPEFKIPSHGDLTAWTEQGVLLVNATLTVTPGKPNSHKGIWDGFLSKLFEVLNNERPNTIYLLWGRDAQDYSSMISDKAVILEAAHPSPRSANKGFFGCQHFKKVNSILKKRGEKVIDWNIK